MNKEKVLDKGSQKGCVMESNCWQWKRSTDSRCVTSLLSQAVDDDEPDGRTYKLLGDFPHFAADSLSGAPLGQNSPWPIKVTVLVLQ